MAAWVMVEDNAWRVVLERLQRFILAHLGGPKAILVLDETAELKKG